MIKINHEQHETLKQKLIEQGKQVGLKGGDIRVLSIDPFFVGSPKDYEDARWAAALWDTMMSRRKKPLHLRGFHYWVMSQVGGTKKPDGTKYAHQDPMRDWSYLLHCAQVARYLGIGEWKNLLDLKHPDPNDYDNYFVGSGISNTGELDIQEELNAKLENIVDEFLGDLLRSCPKYQTDGYQMYHCEVWCEKNSMGFVIEPACRKYSACYQPLVGQSSVEKVNMAANRAIKAAQAGKKVRLFYIADFDRYGWSMVSAVARKLEFGTFGQDVDIKVSRLALNEDHIEQFDLPKAPKHGEAVVELDALEAIHPGALGKIVEEALKPYYDDEKPRLVREENNRIREKARELLEDKLRIPLEEVFLNISLEDIAGEFSLADTINPGFKAPEPEHKVNEDDRSWVYDSSRGYWKQLEAYREYRGSRVEEEA